MKLRKLTLRNVCQFPALVHEFHPGLTGVLGPNGAGKTNFVKAIYFAFTGEFRNPGVKADNVYQLAGPREPADVQLIFEHAGIAYELQRSLRRSQTQLVAAGQAHPVLGEDAVTAEVLRILGIDTKILGEYIFVGQGRMADFIDDTPTGRAKVFGRLFGTESAERIYDFLGDDLARLQVPARSTEIDPLRARLEADGPRLVALYERRGELDAQLEAVPAGLESKLLGQLRAADELDLACGELLAMAGTLEELDSGLSQAGRDVEAGAAEEAGKEAAVAEARQLVDSLRERAARCQVERARQAQASSLASRRSRLEVEAASHTRPLPFTPAPDVVALATRKDDLAKRHRWLDHFVSTFAAGGAECPTCGQQVTDLDDQLQAARQELVEVTGQMQRIRDEFATPLLDHGAALRDYEIWEKAFRQHWEELEHDEVALPPADPTADEGAPVLLKLTERQLETETQALAAARTKHQRAAVTLAESSGARTQVLSEIDRQLERIEAAAGGRTDLGAAQARLASLAAQRQEHTQLSGAITELTRAVEADEALLARLLAAEAAAEHQRDFQRHTATLRSVLHRDAAPRRVAEGYLTRLVHDNNATLARYGVDFRIRLGAGLGFIADFPGGVSSPAARLSEGQKAVLALAFRADVNSLFAGSLGLFVPDEPTQSLDDANLAAVATAVRKLREIAEDSGLQCLLVTHEQALAGLFDDVLQIAPP